MRLPWKLGPGLAPMAPAGDINLKEVPDWPLFSDLMFLSLLLNGLVAGICSWETGDIRRGSRSGFGLRVSKPRE